MGNDQSELLAQVSIGLDAEQFFKTDIGRYVLGASEQDYLAALEKLSTVSPTDREKIIKFQLEAASAKGAINWLRDAIIKSRHAEHELYIKEAEENDNE